MAARIRLLSLVLLVACATNRPSSNGELTVNVVSERPPVVRGYELMRVPALLEQQLRRDLPSTRGTLDLRLVADGYESPAGIPTASPIAWFAVEFTLRDSAGRTVAS